MLNSNYAQLLHHAHAHNDYLKKQPLFDALNCGIPSIEIDVFLYRNEVLISHTGIGLKYQPSFEVRYLIPLQSIILQHGKVFEDGTPLTLMIDLKNEKAALIKQLYELLLPYQALIRTQNNQEAPLIIMLSGNPPLQIIDSLEIPIFSVDGNTHHLWDESTHDFITRVSMNYRKTFSWRGVGKMTKRDQAKLQELVTQANQNNQQLRFWAMPNRKKIWRKFMDYNEVIINVDKYEKFKKFSQSLSSSQSENGH